MLRLLCIDELNDVLLQVPRLVEEQELRSPAFADDTAEWLKRLQKVLESNRLAQAAIVAALRSGLIATRHGVRPPEGSRATRSRMVRMAAADALHKAVEIGVGVLQENGPRLTEAENVARQIVAVARARGILPVRDSSTDASGYLRLVRDALAAEPDLSNAATHLDGLVGRSDALIVLDRALV